jgi:phospholipid/cholesterol/gamma-HCH transport system substrate-binding protein
MDLHYKQEITVGALVVIGIALFIGGTLWLSGKSIGNEPTITISFPDVETLKRGSPIKVSGVPLGTVQEIEFQSYGKVLVRASIDPRVQPRRDASATLASTGLVADAVVNLNPGTAAEPLPADAVIPGQVERGIMSSAGDLAAKASEVLANVSEIANKKLADDLSRTLNAVQRLATLYADRTSGPTAELTRTLTDFRLMRDRLDSTLTQLNLVGRVETADTLVKSLSRLSVDVSTTAARFDSLLAKVNRGEGTLGKFVADTGFYNRARETLRAIQEFVDDIRKHPGKLGITFRIF